MRLKPLESSIQTEQKKYFILCIQLFTLHIEDSKKFFTKAFLILRNLIRSWLSKDKTISIQNFPPLSH